MLLPLGSRARGEEASRRFDGLSLAVKDLRAIRLRFLNQDDIGENQLRLCHLRNLTLILLDEIMKNDAILEVDIARQGDATLGTAEARPVDMAPLLSIAPATTAVSVTPFEETLASLSDGGLDAGVGSFDAQVYGQAEGALRQALLSGDGIEEAVLRWRRVSAAAILWGLVLCASAMILGVSVWVVLALVIGPLEWMRARS